jgi:glycosyltransferase involved in cell wall biosynthesis
VQVLLLNQFYAPDISPTAQLAASLAEHRAALGDDVTVIAGRAGYLEGFEADTTAAAGVRVRRVWTPDLGKSSVARRLLGYLSYLLGAAGRVLVLPAQDVVVVMTTPPLVVVVAVLHRLRHRRRGGGPPRVVLWSMDCYPDVAERFGEIRAGGLASRALRRATRWAFGRLDHVVALDGAMADLLTSQYGAPDRPPCTVVPNWERTALFPAAAAPAEPSGLWDELVPQELTAAGAVRVLYLGNIGVGHRFDTVVDAAAELGEEVAFVFVGGGARRDQLVADAQARGLRNLVVHGYVPKTGTPELLAGADAALITLDDRSLGVISPSKLHSSLAAGLPIAYVGPTGSNVDEAIARFGCGWSLRDGDVDGLVAAVRALRTELRQGTTAARRARSRAAFDTAYCDTVTLPQLDAVLEGRT